MFYVQRHERATRQEAASEHGCVNKLLRHWKKLRRYSVGSTRSSPSVVPNSLKHQVLLCLTRERFFWTGKESDTANHVWRCERYVIGKTTEPSACVPLENIQTCAPMELVCNYFWSAELSDKKTFLQFGNFACLSLSESVRETNRLSAVCGMTSSVFMAFLREYTQTRVQTSEVGS